MGGIDADVMAVELAVLREALALHRVELQNAEQGYVAALASEQRMIAGAAGARAEADRWVTIVDQQRASIRDLAFHIDDVRTSMGATVPVQRASA